MTRRLLVPSSLAREAEDKREATRKLGYVARAAVIFRADELVVFPDPAGEPDRLDGGFVTTVLRYAATPPYLRKEVWDRRDELESVGVLPPLRVPSETGSGPTPGSLREGYVTRVGPDGRVRVNCGLQHPISLPVPPDLAVEEGERVAIRVSSREPVRARIVDEPLPGFTVSRMGLPEALGRPDAGVRIATSRHGEVLSIERLSALVPRIEADGLTVAFGAPGRGLPEILDVPVEAVPGPRVDDDASGPGADAAPVDPDDGPDAPRVGPGVGFDRWLNTIPNQGSEVVRTEEAVIATLATLGLPRR